MNKRFFILFLLLLGASSLFAQFEGGLWFMPELPQANRLNPAFERSRKLVIALPATYFGLANSAFTVGEVQGANGGINLGPVIEGLQPTNYARFWADIQGIALGFQAGKVQFGVGWRVRASAYLRYSDKLAQLFWYGNGPFVDETLQLGPDLHLTGFHETAVRASLPVNDKLRVGGALKYLGGLADISTSRNQLSLYTDPEYYQLTAETDYQVDGSVAIDDWLSTIGQPENWAGANNSGWAMDLGLQYEVNDQWSVAASAIDIGTIRWAGDVSNYRSNGDFTYSGLSLSAYSDTSGLDLDRLVDSLQSAFDPLETHEAYATALPTRVMAGVTWNPTTSLRVGAVYEREWYRSQQFDALAIHGGIHWKDVVYGGLTYTFQEVYQDRLGAQIMVRLGPLQAFAMTHNVLTFFRYADAKTASFRWGVNLVFGKVKKTDVPTSHGTPNLMFEGK